MKKISFYLIPMLVSLLLAGAAEAQESIDLLQMSRDLLASSKASRDSAQALARSNGWLVRGSTERGKVFELQGIENGFPFYYGTFNMNAARTTRTDSVQHYIGSGAGFTIGLWDGDAPRRTHQELASRVTWGDVATAISADHATHVSGTMIASGVKPQAKGMSPQAVIKAFQWDDDLSEMAAEASRGLLISNHSYGLIRGWQWLGEWYWFGDSTISETEDYLFGFYSEDSRKLDELARAAPNYLVVLSAGNERSDSVAPGTSHRYWDSRTGSWRWSTKVRDNDGAPLGYDCIPNGMGIAKNVLTVGAVEDVLDYGGPDSVRMAYFSSWGPTDDGRIKPDICGNGWEVYSSIAESDTSYEYYYGTSMASPNVCGSLALLQDYYRDHHYNIPMKAATLKALAIHTAREAGSAPGPDYGYGWGLLDAYAAYGHITLDLDERKGLIEEFTLIEGVPVELYYECDGTASEFKATICWTDPAGAPPAPSLDPSDFMLVNDLDLTLDRDGEIFEPWMLDPTNPALAASKGNNYRDNVEQVHIASPEAGIYVVRIESKGSLQGGAQDFSLVVSGAVRAKTWHVHGDGSGDAPTIAAAVDSARAGDQIFVYEGNYLEHDIVVDKAITIRAVKGPSTTWVNAGGLGRCFILPSKGGALRLEGLTLKNGAAEGDGVDGYGGAILCGNADAEIVGCVIKQSRAVRGGGIYVDEGIALLKNCSIFENTASEYGGGASIYRWSASMDHCVVSRNNALVDGGGIFFDHAAPTIVNCTVSHNAASERGGGMHFTEGCKADIWYSVVAFTLGGEGIYEEGSSSGVNVVCSDLYGNESGDFGGALYGRIGENGNISEDPQFCDFARFDYAIGDGSPCMSAGNPCGTLIGALGSRCHSKTMWRVKADGTGDAPTIQAAINRAFAGDTIVVAAGIYSGDGNRDILFEGKSLVVTSESGPDSTIVDCGDAFGSIHWGFEYRVGEDPTSVLEGLTIKRASIGGVRCLGASPVIRGCVIDSCISAGGARGGGIYVEKASPKILHCTIRNNRVDTNGGGIFCKESQSLIAHCTVTGNVAAKSGGGIALSTSANVDIVGCAVGGNTATTESGGGIYIVAAIARIDSCSIFGNTGSFGGGVFSGTNAACSLKNSTIRGNGARSGGGGVYGATNTTIESCTIVGNTAAYYGGGVESLYGDRNPITKSIIAFNENGQGIYTIFNTQAISCSDVFSNVGGNYGGSTPDQTGKNNNVSVDPVFCDAGVFDYHIYDTSPCAPEASPCGALVGALAVGCRIAPNLVVAGVEYNRNVAPAHGSIFVTAVVRNDGAVDADSFAIDFYLNRPTAPGNGEAGDFRRVVHSLAVGDTAMFTAGPVTSDTIGEWNSFVAVDANGWVVETDETDNVSGPDSISWIAPREPGWPVAVGTWGRMSPLLVDADGTPGTLEVFAGSNDGKLHAWKSDGTPLAGWPVDLGTVVIYPPAAGDITGDSGVEIVVCDANGLVKAYSSAGTKLWERPATNGLNAALALADIDGDGKLEVLCGSSSFLAVLHVFDGDGTPLWSFNSSGSWMSSPAVGDVDGDGEAEIAVTVVTPLFPARETADPGLGPSLVYLLDNDGGTCPGWPVTVDAVLTADPVIGDVALNHLDLEIVAAGENGLVYVWDAEGSLCFPPCRVPGRIDSSPALGSFDRDGYLDIAVTSRRYTEVEGNGFWEGFTSVISGKGSLIDSLAIFRWVSDTGELPAPIIIGKPPEALAATPDGRIEAADLALSLSCCASIVSTPAAGDIDGDGWVEVLALSGDDSLFAYELCTSRAAPDALWWPMFRRGPARSGSYGYEPVSGVDENKGPALPSVTSLRAIYPNPFNPATRIAFDVARRSRVEISIYDVSGRNVAMLMNREMAPGRYEVVWNGTTSAGRTAASGIYFCRLRSGDLVETKKAVLVR